MCVEEESGICSHRAQVGKNVTLALILLFVLLPLWHPQPNHHPPGIFSTEIALPKGLTCSHCVLQWRYVGGERFHLQLSSMCVLEFRCRQNILFAPLCILGISGLDLKVYKQLNLAIMLRPSKGLKAVTLANSHTSCIIIAIYGMHTCCIIMRSKVAPAQLFKE